MSEPQFKPPRLANFAEKRKYFISNRKMFPPVTQNFAVPVVPSSTRSILGKLFRFPVLNVADIPLEKSRTQELNLKQTFPPEGWLLSAVQGFPISSHVMLSQKRVNSVKAQCTCRKFCLGLSSHKFLLLCQHHRCSSSRTSLLGYDHVSSVNSATSTSDGVFVLQFALASIQN